MKNSQFTRTLMLLGDEGLGRLQSSRVAVFGLGGVGGYVVEGLVRAGIGALDLVDKDEVSFSNLNRQILATHSTIGRLKVDVAKERCLDINPNCVVRTYHSFYLPETADQFDLAKYDYIVDAVDTVTAKLCLIERANAVGTPIISSMGTGNKLDPTAFEVANIFDTSNDRLARIIRKECHRRGIGGFKVVYSKEPTTKPIFEAAEIGEGGAMLADGRCKDVPGSVSFVPSAVGFMVAGEVIKDIASTNTPKAGKP